MFFYRHANYIKSIKSIRLINSASSSITNTTTNLKCFTQIPGPKPLPLIGNLWRYLPVIGEYKLEQIDANARLNLKKYGPIVREVIYGDHVILHLFDPKDIETVFRQEGKYPCRRSHRALLKYRTDRPDQYNSGGIFCENGPEWYRLRRLFQQPLLNPANVNRYIRGCESITDSLIEYIIASRNSYNEVVDFQEDLYKWALENIAFFMLETRLGCLQLNLSPKSDVYKLIGAAHDTIDSIMRTETGSDSWMKKETSEYKKLVSGQETMTQIINYYLKAKINSQDKFDNNSLLSQFFQHPRANYKDIFAMIIDLFLAGIDTTAFTGGFALYYLARYPQVQQRLREEINKVLPQQFDNMLQPNRLARMSYLKACVKETMRLQPVSIGVGRVTTQEAVIKDYEIPIGTMIITQNQIASRQSEHFKDPDLFCPERWLLDARPPPFVSLPFGYGPRMCIGRRFSEMELYVLLAKIIKKFQVEYHYEDIGIKTRLINIPNKSMRFRFVDINSK